MTVNKVMIFQYVAREVAQNVVSTLSKMSNLIADKLQVGDPPVTVTLGKITLDVKKRAANDGILMRISTHIGSSEIMGQLDVPDTACVVSQVFS